jgi:hypothetical protein
MRRSLFIASLLAVSAATAVVVADEGKEPHFDIWLRPVDGALLTGSITEGTPGEPIAEIARVFEAELGEDPKFPFSAFEPGFQSLPGPDTENGVFSFSIPGPILRWTGSDLVASDATMTIGFGPASIVAGAGPVAGFNFETQPSGLLHDHFDYTLNGALGDPEVGVYVLPIAFSGVSPVYTQSPTAWIVFNNGAGEEAHDAAIEFAELFLACGIDLSGDGTVDANDLAVLLGDWGSTTSTADFDKDGTVDASDLAIILGAWGTTCP